MRNKLVGFLTSVIGLAFTMFETRLFGNNMVPESFDELIYDTIGAAIILFGLYLFLTDEKPNQQ